MSHRLSMMPDGASGRWTRTGVLLLALTSTAAIPQVPVQTSYPIRPIRLVVPNSAGGTADTISRLIAQGMSERLGRPVIVDNRPGAGTILGTEAVAKATADGYTLLMSPATLAINPATYKTLPYDALRAFTPISQLALVPSILVVHPSVPARSVRDLIALAKAKPNEILYSSPGHGTIPHLSMELFASMAQIRMLHVPYKGAAPARTDLTVGRVAASTIIAYVPDGKLRALGVTSARRSSAFPDIPTIAESGLPGFELVQWYGLLAPAGTAPAIIARLHKEAAFKLRSPEFKEHLAKLGAEVVASSPEEFAEFLKVETVKIAKLVRGAGIPLE